MSKAIVFLATVIPLFCFGFTPIELQRNRLKFVYAEEFFNLFPEKIESVTVQEIVSADIVKIVQEIFVETVEIFGIDVPREDQNERFARASFLFTSILIRKGQTIFLSYEEQSEDYSEKHLAHIWYYAETESGDKYIVLHSLVMLMNGFARVQMQYPVHDLTLSILFEAQEYARSKNMGIWSDFDENVVAKELEEIFLSVITDSIANLETSSSSDTENDPIVYITDTGKKYHNQGCKYLYKSAKPIRLSEAKKQGYTPCSVCKPPQ